MQHVRLAVVQYVAQPPPRAAGVGYSGGKGGRVPSPRSPRPSSPIRPRLFLPSSLARPFSCPPPVSCGTFMVRKKRDRLDREDRMTTRSADPAGWVAGSIMLALSGRWWPGMMLDLSWSLAGFFCDDSGGEAALAGGIVFASLTAAGFTFGDIKPDAAFVLTSLTLSAWLYHYCQIGASVMVLSTSLVALGTRVLPKWLALGDSWSRNRRCCISPSPFWSPWHGWRRW